MDVTYKLNKIMKMKNLLGTLVAVVLMSCMGRAQQTGDKKDSAAVTEMQKAVASQQHKADSIRKVAEFENWLQGRAQVIAVAEDSHKVAEQRENAAYFDYYRNSYKHRDAVYAWQHTSTIIIFIVVILVVLIGLVFSGIHFYLSVRKSKKHDELVDQLLLAQIRNGEKKPDQIPGVQSGAAQNNQEKEVPTSFEISASGIKMTSSILGVIILGLSLAFFYLYLQSVYPVNKTTIDPTDEPVVRSK
jgi:hypothetical protein